MQPENNIQPNTIPTPTPAPDMSKLQIENKSSVGSIIGTIIVISIIILGGLYFWGKRIDEAKIKNDLVTGSNDTVQVVEDENMEANAIRSIKSSDDVSTIEAELKATNLDNLGAELNAQAQ